MKAYVTKTVTEEIELKLEDFESHGLWSENNVPIAYMYRHKPTGEIYYDECKEAKARKLPIYPFKKVVKPSPGYSL